MLQVSSGVLHGILNISPEKIQAVDMDTINSPIHYSFVSGTPSSYADYFKIDPETGAVRQIRAVDTSTTKMFNIIIKVRGGNRSVAWGTLREVLYATYRIAGACF